MRGISTGRVFRVLPVIEFVDCLFSSAKRFGDPLLDLLTGFRLSCGAFIDSRTLL